MVKTYLLGIFAIVIYLNGYVGTPLDDYVKKPDSHYKYEELGSYRGPGYTLYILNMTSQQWKPDIQSQPIWWHYMAVTIPDVINFTDSAFMLIDGGSNTDGLPKPTDNFVALTTMFAVGTGTVGIDLQQIPNEPIVFKADPQQKRRGEDAIIAWTWKSFVLDNSSDPEILLRMPMTKAAVRAMDAATDFARKKNADIKLEKFMVAGASKRGWTTWTTAAVDKRVMAIAPIVLDCLNFSKNIHHHYRAYGGWSFAFKDYYDLNFTQNLDHPNIQKMADIIDPLSYKERLTMPKYVISTGGDEFFLPDDSHYWFDQMIGPTYLRIMPNAEHSCAGHEISLFFGIRAFYLAQLTGYPLPKFTWKREQTATGGRITVYTQEKPLTIMSYSAKTIGGERRDFRLLVGSKGDPTKPFPHPVVWLSSKVSDMGNGVYIAEYDKEDTGWRAFFVQLTYPGPNGTAFEFTTEVNIIPDTFPFPDCHGTGCRGTLV